MIRYANKGRPAFFPGPRVDRCLADHVHPPVAWKGWDFAGYS